MQRITAHIPDDAREELQRRVDAGEAPSLSAWVAEAVEQALDGAPASDGEEVAALREQVAAALEERDSARAALTEEQTRRRTAEEQRDAVREELHAAQVRLAASEARCEAQQGAAAGTAAPLPAGGEGEGGGVGYWIFESREEEDDPHRRKAALCRADRDISAELVESLVIPLIGGPPEGRP